MLVLHNKRFGKLLNTWLNFSRKRIRKRERERERERERKRGTGARSRGNRGWEEAVCFGKEAW